MRRAAVVVLSMTCAAAIGAAGACSSSGDAPAASGDAGVDAVQPDPRPTRDASDEALPPYVGPTRLSETGLYSDFASRTLAPGLIRWVPAYPLWSDGSEKERYLLLPQGQKIDTSDMDNWMFPVGTKSWKEFRVGGKLIETRFLWKQGTGGVNDWVLISFVWEPDGSDAIARPEGVFNASGTTHDVPNMQDCYNCHQHISDVVVGFSALSLSYPATIPTAPPGDAGSDASDDAGAIEAGAPDAGSVGALTTFAGTGIFSNPPSREFTVPGTGVVHDALAYLHGNCGNCHNATGALKNQSPVRLRILTTDTTPEQTGPYVTAIRQKTRHSMDNGVNLAITPGDPDRSQLYLRMTALDLWRMPPRGTKVIDPAGTKAVHDWILGLPP